MNSTFQLDSHPDAESLNAFAEQVLSEGERGPILVHLAACSRCRQVVFLAQQAASEFEMQQAAAARPELDRVAAFEFATAMAPVPIAVAGAPSGQIAEKRRSLWSGGWRLAWVPAAALAAIIGVVIAVHMQRVRPGFESGVKLAQNVPQAAPQQQSKPAEQVLADKAALAKAQPPASPNTAKVSKEKMFTTPASAPPEVFLAPAAPPAPAPAAEGAMAMSTTELNRAAPLLQPQGQGAGMQLNHAALMRKAAPAAATPRPQLAIGGNSFNDARASTSSATLHGAADQVEPGRSVSATAVEPQSTLKSASIGSFVSGQQMSEPRAESMAARKAGITLLPGGLRAVSIATAQRRTLAIDSSGMLFLSEDSGDHWQPVVQQWDGRAVAVRIQGGSKIDKLVTTDANAAAMEDKSNTSSPDAKAALPAVFEIVNDSDLIWVSTDGKTWKAK
jgi:hypothetical protein